MDHQEFQIFRQELGKTQKQLAELVGSSLKAIQSFEQGWRKVPVHIERQILFLLTLQKKTSDAPPCWDVRNCSMETRHECPAWEFRRGNLCWFINGTRCQGKPQASWTSKMKVCRKCKVFRNDIGMPALKRSSR